MTATAARPVSVDELRRAWQAVQDGQFRGLHRVTGRRPPTTGSPPDGMAWAPAEPVVPVVGCVGRAGASTLALALATRAGDARVVECCTAAGSGLSTAVTAELGTSPTGWVLGRRDRVWVARTDRAVLGAGELAVPDDPVTAVTVTVVDVGWDLDQVLATPGWLADRVCRAQTVVAVTPATIPGVRRLETALTLLGPARVVVAVVGTTRRRWPRALTAALGPHAGACDRAGRLVAITTDRRLAVRGLDSAPLPASLLRAADTLLRLTAADHHEKGHPE
ncbi:MAG: hypothetical protein IPL43_11675 [Micropruina sp.]|nr:hypothetical protein [Micropruina sp.]